MSLLLSTVTMLAVVASAIFFARQARAGRHAAEVASLQAAAEMAQSLYQVFISHPQLWAVFFEGTSLDELTPGDRQRVGPTAEAYLTTWEFLIAVPGRVAEARGAAWRHYAVENFAASPLLCYHLRQRATSYPTELLHLAEQGEQLRRSRQTEGRENGVTVG